MYQREILSDVGMCLHKVLRFFAGRFYELEVANCFHAEVGEAALLTAIEFARATELQVVLGKLKAVFGGRERFESVAGLVAF